MFFAAGGAELGRKAQGRKALAPRWGWGEVHGVILSWLVAQEGAGGYSTRPKAKCEYAVPLLLLGTSFPFMPAPALVVVAEVSVFS